MRSIKFLNSEIKKEYQKLIQIQEGLPGVILYILQNEKIEIVDITGDNQLTIIKDREMINITINRLNNKIYVDSSQNAYIEIYDNIPKKFVYPIAYEYQFNARKLIKSSPLHLKDFKASTIHYKLNDIFDNYYIILDDENRFLNEENFIINILYNATKYDSIRDVFLAITQVIDTKRINVSITDTKGSIIVINDGKVTKYVEYCENNNEYQKIFLENNEFFIEKKVKERYHDEMTNYVKKIGEYYGKERK